MTAAIENRKNHVQSGNAQHQLQRLSATPEFLAVDFFCGAGGTARGLIDAGGYLIAGIDNDPRCERTFVDNNINVCLDNRYPSYLNFDIFPKTKDYPQGQQGELIEKLSCLIGNYRKRCPNVPLLFTICAPCQPFSKLSRRNLTPESKPNRNMDSNLLHESLKFAELFSPELILSENVAGINHPKFKRIWESFRESLVNLDYVTGSAVVCASKFGIPQFRKRSILLAAKRSLVSRDHMVDDRSKELCVPISDSDTELISVKQAIGHFPPIKAGESHSDVPNHRARNLSILNRRRLEVAKPGQSNAYMENTHYGDLSLRCHQNLIKRFGQRCFSDVYTRMHPDRPSPTITTKCHSISNGRFGHFDQKQIRGISLREAAVLQSFKEDYIFFPVDRIDLVARMIGNAVPPKLATFYAKYLSRIQSGDD